MADAPISTGADTYRLELDDAFTRFEFVGLNWVAYTTDGVTHYFEDGDRVGQWRLSRQIDRFGNRIDYTWSVFSLSGFPADYYVTKIEHGRNDSVGLAHHAEVTFEYDVRPGTCPGSTIPVGARVDYGAANDGRQEPYAEGARKLLAIKTWVRDTPGGSYRPVRSVQLGYDSAAETCTGQTAPLRILRSLTESATDAAGVTTTLQPITFTYGVVDPQAGSTQTIASGYVSNGTRSPDGKNDTQRSLMDFNGDGVVDVVRVDGSCRLIVDYGPLGTPLSVETFDLPTMPWPDSTTDYGMFALPRYDAEIGAQCSLSGQLVMRKTQTPPDMPGGITCTQKGSFLSYSFVDYDGDGRTDLLTYFQEDRDWYQHEDDALFPSTDVPTGEIPCSEVPGPELEPECTGAQPVGEQRCGMPVWRVYWNDGDEFVFQRGHLMPVPMTPEGAKTPVGLGRGAYRSGIHGLMDIDGDRKLDLIWRGDATRPQLCLADEWDVYPGDGSGRWYESERYCWKVPFPYADISHSRGNYDPFTPMTSWNAWQARGVLDVNGDGHLDYLSSNVWSSTSAPADIYRGNGKKFLPVANYTTEYGLDVSFIRVDTWGPVANYVWGGDRSQVKRLLDVDGDGMMDLLELPSDVNVSGPYTVRFNVGDAFLAPVTFGSDWRQADRLIRSEATSWTLKRDALDVTGDGRIDLVSWDGTNATVRELTDGISPPHVLRRIDNGRGMVVDFKYAPTTNRDVVGFSRLWELPQVMWVVREMRVTGGHGTPTATTTYRYVDPVFGGEMPGDRPRFLGFREATTVLPAGGESRQKFAYEWTGIYPTDEDRRGRLVEARLYSRDGAGALTLVEHSQTTHVRESLFGDLSYFTHPEVTIERTCEPGIACETQTTSLLRTVHLYEPWSPTGWSSPALFTKAHVEQHQMLSGNAGGDRRSEADAQVFYRGSGMPDSIYFLAPQYSASYEFSSSVWLQTGQRFVTNDNLGLPIETDVWQSATIVATTVKTFDTRTGNVLTVTKPEQYVAGLGKKTSYQYDAHALFTTVVTNELEHDVRATWDVATGAQIERKGPNFKIVRIAGFPTVVWDEEEWRVDGFGRVVEHKVGLDDTTLGYRLEIDQRTTYDDSATTPGWTEERRRDFGVDSWVKTRTRVDGLGRPISETRFRQIGGGAPDEVTTYVYDSAGRLDRIVRPDPRVDTGVTVDAAIFGYDAIDRPIRVTRPLGAVLEKSYAGLRTTLTEVTTDASGSTTHFDNDVFGQLRTVTEVDGTTNAVTSYAYDGNGNLRQVVDADGNVTTLAHDWAGNRLSITRGSRTWAYSYDLNGNMRSELPPRPDGTVAADYTNQMVYDDLDRVRQRVPAPRGLSPSRRAQLGIGTITFHYDGTVGPATNAKGRLSKVVHAVDDPATTPIEALDTEYSYYARGIVYREQRRVVSSYLRSVNATQWVDRTYNALDLETQATFDDASTYKTSYDLRGLVSRVEWLDPATSTWKRVAEHAYSLAGQPRSRTTDFGQDKQTTYDVLGRAYREEVRDLSPVTTRARREFIFDQAGNITRSDFINPALSGAWVYQYDRRHRLRNATAPGYTGAFNFSLAGNITTANVTGPVHPRNVTYGYGAVDPQAVDRLTSTGGAIYASFNYDRAGNTTRRVTPDGTWDLEWDGEDQLRESVGGGKREAYWYDHEGQRTLAILQDGATTEARFWVDLSETTFGTTTKRWLHLPGARVENRTAIELNYADHVSSAEVTLDTNGVPVTAFVYTPWGEPLASMGTTSTHRRRFNDKDSDAATGLSYYGFRYYDPLAARWVSGDPLLRFAPDLSGAGPTNQNLYAFSLLNPIRFLDPNGLTPVCLGSPNCANGRLEDSPDAARASRNGTIMLLLLPAPALAVAARALAAAASNPEVATAVVGTAVGVVDPHPPGGSPVDVPGPFDDAIRAAKATLAKSADDAAAVGGDAAQSGVRANNARGKAFEDQEAAAMEADGWAVAREITLETPGGARTRMDIVGTRGNEVKCVECKASATAPLTPGQTAAHPQIETQGATVKGKGKKNAPGGMTIPPTKVEVRRKKKEQP